jgi:hypothetical protein
MEMFCLMNFYEPNEVVWNQKIINKIYYVGKSFHFLFLIIINVNPEKLI